MNPVQAAQRAAMARQIAQLPPDVRAALVEAGLQDARAILPVPYWSTVRFQASIAAGPPVVYTIDTTPRKAFQYAIGQTMVIAGFDDDVAALCETNLLRPGETRDNSDVWIWGLSAELCTNSEPLLAAQLWRHCSVEISLNGTTSIPLGTLNMFPAAGGLYGSGRSFLEEPPLNQSGGDDGGGTQVGYLSNGNPMAGNFLRFPQPFKWSSVGSNTPDSQLSIIVTPCEQIVVTAALARAADDSPQVAAYTPPAAEGDLGTFVDIRFRLQSVSVAKRSVNT